MKTKRVLRYYCDFCKKSGCSKHHMERHEEHCTLNPNRSCRMCNNYHASDAIKKAIAILPNPKDYVKHDSYDAMLSVATEAVWHDVEELLDHCPACMLSAVRQRGIPVHMAFDYGKACKEYWSEINEEKMQQVGYC